MNIVNGKVYVGKTNNSHKRWIDHLSTSRKSDKKSYSLIHRAINKYGSDNFQYSIIQELSSDEEALCAEKYWIEYYKSYITKYGNTYGYNLTPGGEGTILLGENNPKSKLLKEEVAEIKVSTLSTQELSNIYSVGRTTIQRIRSGEIWETLNNKNNKKKPTNKINYIIANDIRNIFNTTNTSIIDLINKYNISQSLISLILNNKLWKDPKFQLNEIGKQKLSKSKRGNKNPNAILNIDIVKTIREQHSSGIRTSELSKIYNVSETCIYSIVHFRTWKNI